MKKTSDQRSKQEQPAKRTGASKRNRRGERSKLLLVGSEEAFKSEVTHRIFGGLQFRVASKATTLLDALARLESGRIDLVVLSCEFRKEELSLFAFDAQRRGFNGLILCVVPLSSAVTEALTTTRELWGWRFNQKSWEGESRGRAKSRSNEPHHVFPQRETLGVQTPSSFNEPRGFLPFTAREQAVLMRVSQGWTNQQIALHLKCSEGSVKAVLQQLFSKLGVRKRAQIVRMAFEGGPREIAGGASP